MINSDFRQWLLSNTPYSNRVVGDIVCRLKRANRIHPIRLEEIYLFELEHIDEFSKLSVPVKSQIRKAVRLYFRYAKSMGVEENK